MLPFRRRLEASCLKRGSPGRCDKISNEGPGDLGNFSRSQYNGGIGDLILNLFRQRTNKFSTWNSRNLTSLNHHDFGFPAHHTLDCLFANSCQCRLGSHIFDETKPGKYD